MRRVLTLMLLCSFTFGAVDPFGWHLRCPMDNPLAAAAMSAHATPMTSHAMDRMAGMDMSYCHGGPGHESHHSPNHQCCCMGACCCSAVMHVDTGRLVWLPVVPVAVVRITLAVRRALPRPGRPDVVLPPPLGPPTLHV